MFEKVQLRVNLPAEDKLAPPRYQSITKSPIPGGRGSTRVIAGEFDAAKGPAKSFKLILVGDLRFASDNV